MSTSLCFIFVFVSLFLSVCAHKEFSGITVPKQFAYYCDQKCYHGRGHFGYEEHVACTYYPCLPSYSCGDRHKRMPFNEAEKDFILHLHNFYRNLVASGEEKRGGNTEASDMLVMSYDKELEFLASCWSNQCKESRIPALGRDKCRATRLSAHNGQNHWAYASDDYEIDWSDMKYIQRAVDSWYDQVTNVTAGVINSYTNERARHFEFFTQVVWSDTYLVGCGRTMFNADRYIGINIVCNYSPGGNIVDRPVYMRGIPCSRYEYLIHNERYSSLCGVIRNSSLDKYVPPFQLKSSKFGVNLILVFFNFLLNLQFLKFI